ncbi:thiamine pyrophosphokinase 1 isoform X1 [Populus alba]|uniref:thiamine pyrophosphokinase 1 isoform X1 n=1 Tax=Populus alba TaxID=43335 RepID=UPI003CC71911
MDVMTHSSTFLLPGNDHGSSVTYALVVLNQRLPRFTPILWDHGSVSLMAFSFFANCLPPCMRERDKVFSFGFWRCVTAQVRVCADGGANRVFDEMPLLFPRDDALDVRHRYKPDIIKGDMDSIRTEVLDFYTNLVGTKVVDESHDQDTTDLHKCVAYIRDFAPNLDKSNLCILVAAALGGRFDHEAANINVLYRFSTTRIILLSDDCLIYLLPRTHRHEIHIQSSVEGPHCGLIPIGMASVGTTTTGLQWDLTNTEMRFGDLVSTSNLVQGEKITVQSSSDLLWTISIKKV